MSGFKEILGEIRRINAAPEGFLPLHAPVFSGNERAYVMDAIDSTFVSSVGEYVNRIEDMLREITGAAHVTACVNGTAALQVALHLAGTKPGDLVVTQDLSFVATANSIRHCGAEPVFLDVDMNDLGLSPEALRVFLEENCEKRSGGCFYKADGRRVSACVPMHTFGLPCRIEELAALCEEWGLPLIEDAAEALGSYKNGKHCGTFGHFGTLSFNGNKTVTTGGGGAILSGDPEAGKMAKHLTTTAKIPHAWEFRHDFAAWNFRMPNLNAALGCAQLERLEGFLAAKRKLAAAYAGLFAGGPWEFVREPAGCRSNYWLCAVLLRNRAERDEFLKASNETGVMTRPVWEPLHTLEPYRSSPRGNLANTMAIADRLVNLPSSVREHLL